ncbi:hypothetical protein [Kibdelosporangium philippinense]|uniref:hypothetical protein n=1 Tax=Kibdelosporangium philippinense TaxID=211113 RepID=UPI00360A65FE
MVEQVGAAFPGGHLYVDYANLRGPSNDPAVEDAVAGCLRGLGVADEVMPSTLAERTNLYRTKTATRPVLVVLDDVTEPAQVLPLVPNSAGSAVLVTSTDRLAELALDDAQPIPLQPLSEQSSVHMLTVLCGETRVSAEPEAARQLAVLCAGLPIALRVAVARLIARSRLTIADLCGEIMQGLHAFSIKGEAKVSGVFAAAYQALSPAVALMYRRLGAAPFVRFSVDAAAAAADVSVEVADELIERLVDSAFVVAESGRFRMHDLVRKHAEETARAEETESELEAIQHRAVRYILVTAAFADRALMGEGRLRCTDHAVLLAGGTDSFDDPTKALEWLDAERVNLLEAMRIASERGWHDEVWQLAEAATALYVNRRYLADWIEATKLGVAAARHVGRSDVDARLTSFCSRAYLDLGDREQAKQALDHALPVAERLGRKRLIASILELIGRFNDPVDKAGAVEAYQRAISLFAEEEDNRGVAFVTYFLGCTLDSMGQSQQSLVVLRDALELIRRVPNARMAGRTMTAIAVAETNLGDLPAAAETVAQAIQTLSEGGYSHYEAQAQLVKADIAKASGDRGAEADAVGRALEIHVAAGSPQVQSLSERLVELTDATGD